MFDMASKMPVNRKATVLVREEIADWLVSEWVRIRPWCVAAIQTVPDGRVSDGGMVCVLGGLKRNLRMGLCRSQQELSNKGLRWPQGDGG